MQRKAEEWDRVTAEDQEHISGALIRVQRQMLEEAPALMSILLMHDRCTLEILWLVLSQNQEQESRQGEASGAVLHSLTIAV